MTPKHGGPEVLERIPSRRRWSTTSVLEITKDNCQVEHRGGGGGVGLRDNSCISELQAEDSPAGLRHELKAGK